MCLYIWQERLREGGQRRDRRERTAKLRKGGERRAREEREWERGELYMYITIYYTYTFV